MIALFGQAAYRRRDTELLLALAAIAFVTAALFVICLAFLSTIARVLRRIQPEHRRMDPGQVWLNLIPVFNFVWVTVTVERVAESLRSEFAARSLHGPEESYGRKYGLFTIALVAFCVLYVTIPIAGPLAVIFGIAYWRQLNRYAGRLKPGAYSPPPMEEGW